MLALCVAVPISPPMSARSSSSSRYRRARPTPNFAPSWNVAPTDPLPMVRYDCEGTANTPRRDGLVTRAGDRDGQATAGGDFERAPPAEIFGKPSRFGPPVCGASKSSPHANIINHHSGKVAETIHREYDGRATGPRNGAGGQLLDGTFTAGSKTQIKSLSYGISLIFRQTSKSLRTVHSSQPAISFFNRVIHCFGGLLRRTVQPRGLLTMF
jgi:hypothetical protein